MKGHQFCNNIWKPGFFFYKPKEERTNFFKLILSGNLP